MSDSERRTNARLDTPNAFRDGGSVHLALWTLRQKLDLDVAMVTEFDHDGRYVRRLETNLPDFPLRAGSFLSFEQGYCGEIVLGRLPRLIADTAACPAAQAIEETRSLPIGAHIGIPVHLAKGRLFGTLCCFGPTPKPELGQDDLRIMYGFGGLISAALEAEFAAAICDDLIDERRTRSAVARDHSATSAGLSDIGMLLGKARRLAGVLNLADLAGAIGALEGALLDEIEGAQGRMTRQ